MELYNAYSGDSGQHAPCMREADRIKSDAGISNHNILLLFSDRLVRRVSPGCSRNIACGCRKYSFEMTGACNHKMTVIGECTRDAIADAYWNNRKNILDKAGTDASILQVITKSLKERCRLYYKWTPVNYFP